MSIPTSNLYDFVHQVLEKEYWLEYFHPWGTRTLENVISYQKTQVDIPIEKQLCRKIFPEQLCTWDTIREWQPFVLCHDQEPLNFQLHQDKQNQYHPSVNPNKLPTYSVTNNYNLRYINPGAGQKYWILLHSELNSQELEKYSASGHFIGAYWWSHACIALDWYRFAEHDKSINAITPSTKTFLIYNREQSGSRIYRKQFMNLLSKHNMSNTCQVGSFSSDQVTSDSSATYNSEDFNRTDISVILETVADQRIHLTEKTLRAIALGHPFYLMAGPGALEYLKSYGFRTFSSCIDESYDKEQDQMLRMGKIVQSMQKFTMLDNLSRTQALSEMREIAKHNKKLFFSKEFFEQISKELRCNVESANRIANDEIDWKRLWQTRCHRKKYFPNLCTTNREYIVPLLKHLKTGGTLDNYVPPWQD